MTVEPHTHCQRTFAGIGTCTSRNRCWCASTVKTSTRQQSRPIATTCLHRATAQRRSLYIGSMSFEQMSTPHCHVQVPADDRTAALETTVTLRQLTCRHFALRRRKSSTDGA